MILLKQPPRLVDHCEDSIIMNLCEVSDSFFLFSISLFWKDVCRMFLFTIKGLEIDLEPL